MMKKMMMMAIDLEVRPSLIPGAGQGLFLAKQQSQKKVMEGDVLCEYTGTVLNTKEALRLEDKSYLMRLGSQVYVDAKDHKECLARYINDCRNPFGYNVHLIKLPEEEKALVVACRDILPGEELYVDYGRLYWLSHHVGGGKVGRLTVKDLCQQQMRREEERASASDVHR